MTPFNHLIKSHSRASPNLVFFWIFSLGSVVISNEDRGVDWEVSEARLICWLFAVLGGEVIVLVLHSLLNLNLRMIEDYCRRSCLLPCCRWCDMLFVDF